MPDLAAIRKRYEAATPPPWEFEDNFKRQADREFANHARTDLPAVVEALEKAQKALRTLRVLAVAAEASNAVLGDVRAVGKTLPKHIRETVDAILGESE